MKSKEQTTKRIALHVDYTICITINEYYYQDLLVEINHSALTKQNTSKLSCISSAVENERIIHLPYKLDIRTVMHVPVHTHLAEPNMYYGTSATPVSERKPLTKIFEYFQWSDYCSNSMEVYVHVVDLFITLKNALKKNHQVPTNDVNMIMKLTTYLHRP